MTDDEETPEAIIRSGRPPGRVIMRVVEGRNRGAGAELAFGEPLSVGKSPDNQLRLEDITVSRYHAEFTLKRGGVEVLDLDSTNGTYVGTVRVSRAYVRPASIVMIGTNTILITAVPGWAEMPTREGQDAIGVYDLPGVVAQSPGMRKASERIVRLGASDVSVLFQGETGTGKEVMARALHQVSARSAGPFEVVDCGSMPPSLVASELFGHERGSFTGAHAQHLGAFERAHGGTLFLDEVGELPLELQPMLLGVLERRAFRRIGARLERHVDVRIMSATHRDLRTATNQGTFRADLYFRLAVARVEVPPLRDRPEDIAPLVAHFAHELTGRADEQLFDRRALQTLERLAWSGNVRELRNMVESAVALGSSEALVGEVEHLVGGEDGDASGADTNAPYRVARANAMATFERSYLKKLLEACGDNVSEAARRAVMDRHHLLKLLRRHSLR